jgi:NADH:ubiquinone oxidoreductase subunit 5 (subunit L)/multisubunit Na+/H+ antiporter MnhA subunit
MSGVMVKTGIYGLVRALTLLPAAPAWWGWLLVGIGIISGIWGVLFALAQHDLKRLLAYHTVENIGIIALGLGTGLLGASSGSPLLAVLGLSGALFHVVNHALFKGLLFLGAGAVVHATGTRDIDHLGGLARLMPVTALAFIVGAVAISGLPPLNGFASEFLIYQGAFRATTTLGPAGAAPGLLVIGALALIGGLAAICFTKVVGIVFLGEPRTEAAAQAHPPGLLMVAPMVVLAVGCLLVGLFAPVVVGSIVPIAAEAVHLPSPVPSSLASAATAPLASVVAVGAFLLVAIGVLSVLRRLLLAGRPVESTGTWDCGYARPTARMQYTASSYVQPATELFRGLLHTRTELSAPSGLFPQTATFHSETPDVCENVLYRPIFGAVGRAIGRLRWLQQGSVHVYAMYIAVTLIVLLIWFVGVTR